MKSLSDTASRMGDTLQLWFAATLLILLCACSPDKPGAGGSAARPPGTIVAGPNERSFSERYRSTLKLPVAEASFLQLLDHLGLQYRLDRDRSAGAVIPTPRWNSSMDMSGIERMYVVEGSYDKATQTTERYRVYVSHDGEVLYIENNFAYPPIG
jgi:hypothetical protein